jgi:predicted Ser/Thr protein kinase
LSRVWAGSVAIIDEVDDETVQGRREPMSTVELRAGSRVGRYVLIRAVGKGAMGTVWAARDVDLDRDVALKLLHEARADGRTRMRLVREARAMARLKHANVVTVYEVGSDGACDFIAMELVDGSNLARWLRAGRRRGDEVWRALIAAGRGLAAAHDAGLVHRDFKPHNVLIGGDRSVRVTDFGIVRWVDEHGDSGTGRDGADIATSGSELQLTETGALLGTPAYMALEQWDGRPADARSDQFAFCITAWEALTGARPFQGDKVPELHDAVRRGIPTGGRSLPRAVRAVLTRGMSPDPAARFPTMTDLLDAMAAARKRPVVIAVAATLVVVAVGGGVGAAMLVTGGAAPAWTPEVSAIEPVFEENSHGAVFSPDGRELAFVASRGDDTWRLYVQPVMGGTPRAIADNCAARMPSWSDDGTAVIAQCEGDGVSGHVQRIPTGGGAIRDLGPGVEAVPCRGGLLVAMPERLVLRDAGGVDRTIADGPIFTVRCAPDGQTIGFIRRPFADGLDNAQLWLVGADQPRLVWRGGMTGFAFTPGVHSVVISRVVDDGYDLYELVLDSGAMHRLTTTGNARQVDVSRDGTAVVFDDDVTTVPLFERAGDRFEPKTFAVEVLDHPVASPAGDRVVVERFEHGGASLVVVTTADASERTLAAGHQPFLSRDGKRVLFAANDDPRRLLSIPLEGGATELVGTLPGPLVDGAAGGDGIHVEVGSAGHTHGWRLRDDGAFVDENVDGLVFAASSGWRAVRLHTAAGDVVRVAPPGVAASQATGDRRIVGQPVWVGEHELASCDCKTCVRVDTASGAVIDTAPLACNPRHALTLAADGRRAFTTHSIGHITRRHITNFAERPWRP